jgi:hypothetical protein
MTRRDPIVAEVRKHREAFAREHGNSVDAIVAALRREEASGSVPTVSFPSKKIGKDLRRGAGKNRRPSQRVAPTARRG